MLARCTVKPTYNSTRWKNIVPPAPYVKWAAYYNTIIPCRWLRQVQVWSEKEKKDNATFFLCMVDFCIFFILKNITLIRCIIRHCFLHCLVCTSWPKKSITWVRSRQNYNWVSYWVAVNMLIWLVVCCVFNTYLWLIFIDSHAVYSTGISLAFCHFISEFGCGTIWGPSSEALVEVSVLCFCCGVIGCLSFLFVA